MHYLGNKNILTNYKIGFLCSRKVPAEKILKIYDWAIEQREKGICVVSGFHSKIEKDVFHYLSKGSQPIILVLARGLLSKWPDNITRLITKEQLLVITMFDNAVKRVSTDTAFLRNKMILQIVDELAVGYIAKNGLLAKQIKSDYGDVNPKVIYI